MPRLNNVVFNVNGNNADKNNLSSLKLVWNIESASATNGNAKRRRKCSSRTYCKANNRTHNQQFLQRLFTFNCKWQFNKSPKWCCLKAVSIAGKFALLWIDFLQILHILLVRICSSVFQFRSVWPITDYTYSMYAWISNCHLTSSITISICTSNVDERRFPIRITGFVGQTLFIGSIRISIHRINDFYC